MNYNCPLSMIEGRDFGAVSKLCPLGVGVGVRWVKEIKFYVHVNYW